MGVGEREEGGGEEEGLVVDVNMDEKRRIYRQVACIGSGSLNYQLLKVFPHRHPCEISKE